ncbi:BACON domain-containing carbohydrate-binding protein [Haliscomenobacter sp.]|uniref:BACON domain-containing protein n=1 Tax=Haliscomenobacter sp. TaxID=2717303 RepID=UPI003364C666
MKPFNAPLSLLRTTVQILFLFSPIFLRAQPWGNDFLNPKGNLGTIKKNAETYFQKAGTAKGSGFKQYKRWEYYWKNRVNKDGSFPAANVRQIEMGKYNSGLKGVQQSGGSSWTSLGPNSSSGGYGGVGRINRVAFHPSNANTFFACTAGGGLWKTSNGGTSWATLTGNLSRIGTSDLVIHPTNPDTMYLATGDCDGFDTPSLGVFKTTDGGTTWNATGLSFTDGQSVVIFKLIMHASNTSIIMAATNAGIYRTIDAGATWTRVFSSAIIYDLEKKPGDANTFYACSGTQIYTSADAGATWTSRTTIAGARRIALAVSAANSSFVGALVAKSSDNGFLGFYASTDSGVNWSSRSISPNLLGWNVTGNDSGGQGWYDLCLAIDPANANNIYIGGVNTWKSTNGGTSWVINTMWYATGSIPEVHADKHDIAFQNNSTLFQCNDGGIYKSTNGGSSWTDLTNGMSISQMYKIGVSQTDTKVIAGLQDNGTKLKSTANTWADKIGGDGMDCAIDPSNGNIMYGELYYGDIYRSINGGSGWSAIAPNIGFEGAGWVTPFALAPSAPATIYIGYENLYKSSNNGTSWTKMTNGQTGGYIINNIAIAPSNANVVYFSSDQYLNSGGNLYKTTDGGSTTTTLTKPNSSGYINGIAIDNTNPNNVWVCMAGYSAGLKVYKSTNGGSTWTNVSGTLPNLPANCLAYANGSNGALYLGMDVGVYYIDNTLSDWVLFNTGLPNAEIFDLEIQYATSTIKAGTYGRGLWESPLFTGADSTLTVSTTSQTSSSSAGSFTITVTANVDWSVSSDAGWLTVSPTSGNNNGTVTATFTANTGAVRTGTITFTAGTLIQTVTVTQAILVEISVSPTTKSISPPAGSFAISLSSNSAWTVSSNAAWLTASPTSSASNASVTANFTANTGAARTGILTFSAGGVTRTVTVTQATSALTVSPTTQAASAAAGNFAITLTSNVNWTVSSNAVWLTASPTSGSNDGSITASYTANTGAARSGTLTFSGGGLTRTVTVTQATPNLTVTPTTQSVSALEGTFAITLTSNVAWTVNSNAVWLSTSPTSGSNNATVNAIYTANTGASSRSGILTFTGGGITRTVTVTQVAPILTVSPTTLAPSAAAGSFAITLTSNVPWTVNSSEAWLTVNPTSGSNNGTLTASYTANTDAFRTGILTFTGGGLTRTVTVTQAAPTLSVTPTTQARTSAAGSFTTTLTSNVAWTVISDAVWLTTTVSSGSNNATVTANYTANTGDARTGVLTFMGGGITRTVTVTQATPPVLTLSPTTQAVSAAAGNFVITLNANIAWTVTSNTAWLTATPTSGSNNGTVNAIFTANTGTARTGVLTFAGGGLTRTVTVTQAAPNLTITPTTQSVTPLAGSFAITLTSNVNWTVSSNAVWLTFSPVSGKDNGSITANYTANTGALRTGTLTFSGGGISRTLTVTQAAPALTLSPTTAAPGAAEGSFAITVTANINWTVASNAAWLTTAVTSGTGNAVVTANYAANTGAVRTGVLTFTGGGLTRTVTVTQATPTLTVTPTTQSRTIAAGSFTTTLTSNVAWTVSSNVPWMASTPVSGTNNATITTNYTANDKAARVGILTFTGGGITRTVTVNQAGLPAYLIVSPLSKSVISTPDTFQFSVSANIPWTVSNSGSWLMPGIVNGVNDGRGFVYFQQNNGSLLRRDTVYVSGSGITRKIVVTQDEGSAAGVTLEVETNAISAAASAAMVLDSITSNGCWTIRESASWIMSGVSEGFGNAKITLFLQPNTSGTSRSAVVTVSANGISRSITITQGAAGTNFTTATTLDEFVHQIAYTTKTEGRIPRIELYPNPAQNTVNIVFDALDTKDQSPRLVVFDGMGRIVVQKDKTSNLQQLDVSDFATGMYIFNFYLSDNKIINKKLIINRN